MPSVFAAQSVTVEQIAHIISASRNQSDGNIAKQLYEMKLSQRLNAQKLAALQAGLPGQKSRQALAMLADQAEFLQLPPSDIPDQPAPSLAGQQAILARAADYVKATLHRFPHLYARRESIQYADKPIVKRNRHAGEYLIRYQPLHPISRSVATVDYRDGTELILENSKSSNGSFPRATHGASTAGEFGPIFNLFLEDLRSDSLQWSHWEKGPSGIEAVFRVAVSRTESQYQVYYCCVDHQNFEDHPAYHAELSLDPSTGTILRVTVIADMAGNNPIQESEVMVEYGPVELGAKRYYCPIRSVTVLRAPVNERRQKPGIGTRNVFGPGNFLSEAPLQTMINEITFDRYHLFRSDVHVVGTN